MSSGRGGLGQEHHLKEKQVEKKAKQVTIERDFRQRRLEVLLERRVTGDLRKSQAACELLDSREVIRSVSHHNRYIYLAYIFLPYFYRMSYSLS